MNDAVGRFAARARAIRSRRDLPLAERAERVARLMAEGAAAARVATEVLPALGMRPQAADLALLLGYAAAPAAFRETAAAGDLPFEAWRFVERYPADDRLALARFFAAHPVSRSHKALLAEWLLDLSAREGETVAALLADALAAAGEAPDAARRVVEALRRRRFPNLAAAEARFSAALGRLKPRRVRVAPPAGFEEPHREIFFRAASVAEFRAAAEELARLAADPGLAELFEEEGGEPGPGAPAGVRDPRTRE